MTFSKSVQQLLLLCLCVLPELGFSQTDKNDTVYYSRTWEITTRDSARFYRLPRVQTDSGYRFTDYYINGRIQMLGYATNAGCNIRIGYSVQYDSLGFIIETGSYNKGMRQGKWTRYYANCNIIKAEMVFENENGTGHYKSYDSSTSTLVLEEYRIEGKANGISKRYYIGGGNELFATGKLKYGIPDSTMVYYYRNGKVKRIDYYNNGKPGKKGQCFDENGNRIAYTAFREKPRLARRPGSKLANSLEKQLKERGLKELQIIMSLDASGKVTAYTIIPDKKDDLYATAEKLAQEMDQWTPMKVNDVPVDCEVHFSFYPDKSGYIIYRTLKDISEY